MPESEPAQIQPTNTEKLLAFARVAFHAEVHVGLSTPETVIEAPVLATDET